MCVVQCKERRCIVTLAESFKIAAEYWPELVSLGLFLLGSMALAAAVAWVEGRMQSGE